MLYISTRSKTDSFTSHRPLHEYTAPDGGMFVPFRLPQYFGGDIISFTQRSFGENIAAILNLFFSVRLSGWDVDCCIGRHPVRLKKMGHRIIIAETWHNLESRYSYIEESLYRRMISGKNSAPTPWFRIALRVAIIFGIYGQLLADGECEVDIALPSGDFMFAMAAWYAKKMGLPIGRIICACNENDNVWDLVNRGELNFLPANRSQHLESNTEYPVYLEQMIFELFGLDECARFLEKCSSRSNYRISAEAQNLFQESISAAVIWRSRVEAIIASFHSTNAYTLDLDAALAFGAVQDIRASTGENRFTIVFADRENNR